MNRLVNSIRGPKGGYLLAKKPSEIKLSKIFSALEGPINNVDCTKHAKFSKGCNDCVVSFLWSKFNKNTWDLFESMTLQDMVDMAEGKKKPRSV
jgi:Rrf2 family protein